MNKNLTLAIMLFIMPVALFVGGCGGVKVERINDDEIIDLSGRWNDSDSRITAERLVSDALSRPWVGRFEGEKGTQPRVIVGSIVNKTSQHIATETFVRDLERELTNSGRVIFVAAGNERDEIRGEREDQQYWSNDKTIKQMRNEYGADFMLQGTVNSITDKSGKQQVILYQVDMTMTNLETNERVWFGNSEIRKFVKNQPARL